jgi:hypothetical protein
MPESVLCRDPKRKLIEAAIAFIHNVNSNTKNIFSLSSFYDNTDKELKN